jgi:uncharacterized protein (DUF1778 family)
MNAALTKLPRVRRETVVNLRMTRLMRDLIDSAAAVAGKTRTDFIIESSRARAIDVLLDQRLFTLNETQYGAFLRALDEKPAPNEKLKALLSGKAPWER